MRTTNRKHMAYIDTEFRRLIYPLDTSYIRDLDSANAKMWVKAGWSIEKTVMLEIDYLTLPAIHSIDTAIPSNLFAGIIYAWNSGKYYRTVAFSRGYFQNIDELNLRLDAQHEEHHLKDAENYLATGTRVSTEDELAGSEVKYVLKTYGRQGFEARKKRVLEEFERLKSAEAIPGQVALLWLREYFEREFTKYRSLSFDIPPDNIRARQIKEEDYLSIVDPVASTYRTAFEIGPSTIFKHSLKSR